MRRKRLIQGKYTKLLPLDGFDDYDYVELHHVAPGVAVVVGKKGELPHTSGLIQKLKRIPFAERDYEKLLQTLSDEEKQEMQDYLEKGLLQVKDGKVYLDQSFYGKRRFEDFLVVSGEEEIARMNRRYEAELVSGELFGIRHFDGKLYLVRREYFEKHREKVLQALPEEEEIGIEELASAVGLPCEKLLPILVILLHQGEVVEASKNKFKRV